MTDLTKSSGERCLERGAFVLRQSFLSDVERHQFPFGNFDIRKAGNRLGIIKAKVKLIVLDWETQPVAHEIDIALDRFRTDFQLISEFPAVGVTAGLQPLMHAHHALKRRTRIKASSAAGCKSDALHSREH